MLRFFALVSLLSLTACPTQFGGLPLIPTRAFLSSSRIPPPDVGAYGVAALRAKPTPANTARLNMFCTAFIKTLPSQYSLPVGMPVTQEMITIWPIDTAKPVQLPQENCDYLLDHYDLYGGVAAIADATAQRKNLSGRGPFLIGWSPSNSRQIPDAIVLVVDMSDFDTQDSFDEALMFWQRKIVEDPSLWTSGFSAERIRLATRDFADRYGTSILKAVKLGAQ
jgi:hypothetical protein